MSRDFLVSIVVSSYNYGRFLNECIDSALQQTYPHTEVIVVDDASSDNSREIILEYGGRIVPVLRERNEGARSTYSSACRLSHGEAIIILDSDDMLIPTTVEKIVPWFAEPDVVKVHWPLWEINSSGKKTGRLDPCLDLPQGDLRGEIPANGPFYYAFPSTSGNAYARSFMQEFLPLPAGAYVDAYLSMWALVSGTIRRVSEPQGYYRLHGQNNYGKRPFEQRVKKDLTFAELCCTQLSEYYSSRGISVDVNAWKRHSWYHLLDASMRELEELVPPGESFILVDEDNWATQGSVVGRRAIPFPERDDCYAGPPEDDAQAITEFERLRNKGAGFMAFAWQGFWWLDYYKSLSHHLRSHFACVLENDHLIIFDLRRTPG